jgi:hypothetical protein
VWLFELAPFFEMVSDSITLLLLAASSVFENF